MKRLLIALALACLLVLVSVPTTAQTPKEGLEAARQEFIDAREEVNKNWDILISQVDSFAGQILEFSLSDALVVIDDWEVDRCWLPWYAIARSFFEMQIEAISLSRLGIPPEMTSQILFATQAISGLEEKLYQTALKECEDGNTGTAP